ncbi:hypothetical protein CRV24_007556 [Beauveria bassiana]|nr:hypothetical protein CRV24_007556 [Beauveria bassiana]
MRQLISSSDYESKGPTHHNLAARPNKKVPRRGRNLFFSHPSILTRLRRSTISTFIDRSCGRHAITLPPKVSSQLLHGALLPRLTVLNVSLGPGVRNTKSHEIETSRKQKENKKHRSRCHQLSQQHIEHTQPNHESRIHSKLPQRAKLVLHIHT